MSIVYQVLSITYLKDSYQRVRLSHVVQKKSIAATVHHLKVGEMDQLLLQKDGEEIAYLIEGVYKDHSRMCGFRNGETVFVFTDDKKMVYTNVKNVATSPVDYPIEEGDLLIVAE